MGSFLLLLVHHLFEGLFFEVAGLRVLPQKDLRIKRCQTLFKLGTRSDFKERINIVQDGGGVIHFLDFGFGKMGKDQHKVLFLKIFAFQS